MPQQFQGIVGRTIEESTPAWPQPIRAREGAPNILFIVLDDVAATARSINWWTLRNTPNLDQSPQNGLVDRGRPEQRSAPPGHFLGPWPRPAQARRASHPLRVPARRRPHRFLRRCQRQEPLSHYHGGSRDPARRRGGRAAICRQPLWWLRPLRKRRTPPVRLQSPIPRPLPAPVL